MQPLSRIQTWLMSAGCLTGILSADEVTTPDEFLGRPLASDHQLADWSEVSGYFQLLATESDHVTTASIGKTTEGRDFLISIISSKENLADLDEIKRRSSVIADPRLRSEVERRDAIENGKVILLVSPQMHSTEAAGTEAGMRFAHQLATSEEEPWRSARERMVVGIFPCTNPDGLDHVVHWYRKNVGTPYEASGLLKLYQKYSGHDNNRDWFMLTQNETRLVTEQIYQVWRPQVYWDMHQQGSRKERMFVPPFRDPLNPNLDPAVIAGIGVIGGRAMFDLTRAGLSGISTGVTYDMWWNGGNRNVPVRHNIIGLLTEAASVDIATPLFLRRSDLASPVGHPQYAPSNQFPAPWPGGWWRLKDINEYQFQFGKSLVGTLAREPQTWLRSAAEAAGRAIEKGRGEGVKAWLIPSDNRDPDAVGRLVDVLLRSGVEIEVANAVVDADGRSYPAVSILIWRDQPYGAHVKDLFEIQRYPEGAPPYDVSGWTLPSLLGVRRIEVMKRPDVVTSRVDSAADAIKAFAGDLRAKQEDQFSIHSSSAWTRLAKRLVADETTYLISDGANEGIFVTDLGLAELAKVNQLSGMPRIGIYSPWSGNMDEGWMRYMFDSFQIPFISVKNEQLRAGNLSDFIDVLVVSSVSGRQLDSGRSEGSVPAEYTGGLAPEGSVAVEEFVRGGGKLVTVGSSSQWAIDLFALPLVDVTREAKNRGFSCPGSVVRCVSAVGARDMTLGLPPSIGVFFSRSSAWRMGTEKGDGGNDPVKKRLAPVLNYGRQPVLLSGWMKQPEVIAGQHAWVQADYGEGTIQLFGFRPQYRGWSQAAFSLLFRSLFL
jgi:hypothetical protein